MKGDWYKVDNVANVFLATMVKRDTRSLRISITLKEDIKKHLTSAFIPQPSDIMSEVSEAIQAKCLAFSDRIIKLNDYLLAQAVAAHEDS